MANVNSTVDLARRSMYGAVTEAHSWLEVFGKLDAENASPMEILAEGVLRRFIDSWGAFDHAVELSGGIGGSAPDAGHESGPSTEVERGALSSPDAQSPARPGKLSSSASE